MKSVMTAGLDFGKQLTDQNPEMAEIMGPDGVQVRFYLLNFFNKYFWQTKVLFCGPLIPLFWGQPYLHFGGDIGVIHDLKLTCGATPADFLMTSCLLAQFPTHHRQRR